MLLESYCLSCLHTHVHVSEARNLTSTHTHMHTHTLTRTRTRTRTRTCTMKSYQLRNATVSCAVPTPAWVATKAHWLQGNL